MNWTNEQEQAITIRSKSIIVSASAGSGKTAVLVERLLRILSDMDHPVKANEIIVVTFTNDAAAEMKQRLTKAISEKLDSMNRDSLQDEAKQAQYQEQYQWLLQQRSLLGNAKISTIHAFCFDLIRENAEECGVSSQFKIAEPAQDAVYRRRALQTVLERFSKQHREESELLFSCFCTRNDKKLEQILTSIDKYLNSLAFPDYWLMKAKKLCQEENTLLLDSIRKAFCDRLADAVAIAENGRETAQEAAFSSNGNYPYEEQILEPEISMMQNQMRYVRTADKETLLANPEAYPVSFRSLRIKTAGCEKDPAQYEIWKNIRDLYKEIYQDACKKFLAPLKFYTEDQKIQNQIIPLLLDLTKQYREELFQEKKQQNVLGFDDAEYLVLTKLLGQVDEQGRVRRTELAKAFAKQYQFLMVDEYQDSNNRQDCLFRLLADGNSQEDSENQEFQLNYGNHIFLVGDVKQAIYRFRNANPENFMSAIAISHSEPDMEAISLNQNFRSSQSVVNFVNAFFSGVMTRECGEVDYSISEQLNFGAKRYQGLEEAYQKTQILFAQSVSKKNSEKSANKKEKNFPDQAACIADTIQRMIMEEYPVVTADGIRPCQFKDFCILMRTKTNNSILAEEFRKRNIPFLCQEDSHFLELPEIRLIWNLLRIVSNPMTDLAMASVLLSPLYAFSTEELAILKLLAPDKKRLYLQIRHLAEQE
nr:UvrD-helicase domain-containing protein [Oscillospiraceae bacterium]